MVVMWVWLLDIALSAVIGSSRFDLGFYAGRMFGLVAASFLLVTLLVEMARLYSGALGAAASAEQNLARMIQSQRRAGLKPRRDESTEDFVQRQNVEHFRALLDSGTLDGANASGSRICWPSFRKSRRGRRTVDGAATRAAMNASQAALR